MKELCRVRMIATERGNFRAEFLNLVTGETDMRYYRTHKGMCCAVTKYNKRMVRLYGHLLQEA